jgi:hypothetical protein
VPRLHKWQQVLNVLESGEWIKSDDISIDAIGVAMTISGLRKRGYQIDTRLEWHGRTATTYYRLLKSRTG